jgi:indolepyruvate ferredoxin oxidoreductase beta subunit
MKPFNIYLTGVGGQGIGLISEVVLRAADYAGFGVKGVDTHGLAQRGGSVVSQIRIGDPVYTPLIPQGEADLVIALERHEALRGMNIALKNGGTLLYYNTIQQPLEVRLNQSGETPEALITESARKRGINEIKVMTTDLPDPRMQNIALLAAVVGHELVPGVNVDHYRQAISDLLTGPLLKTNLEVFEKLLAEQ